MAFHAARHWVEPSSTAALGGRDLIDEGYRVADAVAVDRLAAGDHACLTYSDPDERLDVLGLVGTVLDAYGLPGTPRIRVRAT